MTVADLDVQMNVSGNLVQQMRTAEQGLQRMNRQVEDLEQTIRGMTGPGAGFRRDMQQAGNAAQDAGRAGQQAGQQMGQGFQQGAQQAENAMDGMADHAGQAGSRAGDTGGGGFMGGFTDKIKGLGGKGGPIAMALVAVAGVGLVAGGVLAKAIADGMEAEAQKDKIQASMGISDAEMGKLARASATAYTNVFGESVQSNMEVARRAIQSGLLGGEGFTQQELQKVIEGATTVADLMEEDVMAVTRSASQLFKNGLAANAEEAFDIILKGQQAGLNVSEDWLDTIDEYSTQWRQLGLNAEDAMALQSQMVKKGARDTDTAADALKEFAIRARDGSKSSTEAFEALGLGAEEYTAKFAAGGESAKTALQDVLKAMQGLDDPVEKSTVAVGLFGTKAEDLGLALNNLDLDRARQEFGTTAGTIAEATRVAGDNAATSIEGAKRSIEVSMNSVKASMAEAFGPTLQQIANWINTHKPEIIAFFVGLADAALATAQGIASFVSGTLRYFSMMSAASASFFGNMIEGFGQLAEGIGKVVKHIPGMKDTGEALEGTGAAMQNYKQFMQDTSGTLSEWADKVDAGNTALGNVREGLQGAGADAVASAEMFRALGDDVISIPDEKTIIVQDNSPEAQKRFEEMGISIQEIPGTKDFKLVANTADGQAKINAFISENTGKKITLDAEVALSARVQNGELTVGPGSAWASKQADGGVYREAQITDKPILWGEAGPEAYIPLSESKRARSKALLAEVAQRFGMQLMADGGILDTRQLTSKASTIEGAQYTWGGWGNGWNTDCSGAQARVANMIAYGNPDDGGRFSTANQGAALAARGFKNGKAPAGVPAYESGWKNGGPGGGHTAGSFVFADGSRVNVEMGGARGDGQYGGPTGSRDFDNIMYYPLTTAAEGPGIGASGVSPGSTGAGGTSGGGGTVPTVSVSMPDVIKTEVMNWPSSLTDPNGGGARARFGVALYADGGTVPGVGNRDTEAALLTPGEEVTPAGMARKHRALLKAIARDQVGGYAVGGTVGFGGFTTPKKNNYLSGRHALYGLVGGAFALASGWDDTGKFQGFDTSSTRVPGAETQLSTLLEQLTKIAEKPTVVIEHAEIKTDDPQGLVEQTTDPLQTAISTMRV